MTFVRRHPFVTVLATIVIAALITVLVLNLSSSEKKIKERNGVEIFPAMLGAIKEGKRTVTFETFIYWSGSIGRDFADALSGRARAGVKVHVLLDWVGSTRMEAELLERMEQAGVDVRRYHPPRWYTLSKMNNRTHRKLLVIDGTVGFTGGVGIADPWLGDAQDKEH